MESHKKATSSPRTVKKSISPSKLSECLYLNIFMEQKLIWVYPFLFGFFPSPASGPPLLLYPLFRAVCVCFFAFLYCFRFRFRFRSTGPATLPPVSYEQNFRLVVKWLKFTFHFSTSTLVPFWSQVQVFGIFTSFGHTVFFFFLIFTNFSKAGNATGFQKYSSSQKKW